MILENLSNRLRSEKKSPLPPEEQKVRLDQFQGFLEGTIKDPYLATMIDTGGFNEAFSRATRPKDIAAAIGKIYTQCNKGANLQRDFPVAHDRFLIEVQAEIDDAKGIQEDRIKRMLRLMAAEIKVT